MTLNYKVKYKSGETCNLGDDLNEAQLKKLNQYLKDGDFNMEKAIITNKTK